MSLLSSLRLALRYLRGYFRRFIFLFLALAFGFAIITLTTSLSAGMTRSVYRASQNHYGGQVFILGYDKDAGTMIRVDKDAQILEAVAASGLKPDRMVRRTNVFRDGILYFNGTAVRQKNVLGIDWAAERQDFFHLDWTVPPVGDPSGRDWILLSEPVARQLGAREGDCVVLEVRTRYGQRNTGTFVVRGILRDSSIFGYFKCFVDRGRLNGLISYSPDEYSSLGLYFQDPRSLPEKTDRLYDALQSRVPTGPRIRDKNDLTVQQGKSWKGVRYFAISLNVYVSQVGDLLTAMELLSYFVYIAITVIVLVSILVTYRLILYERTRELATLRALGSGSGAVRQVLVLEALFLFLVSMATGFALAVTAGYGASFLSLKSIPGFEIFLTKGKLAPVYEPKTVILNFLILLGITVPGVILPAFRFSRIPLSTSLSGGVS